MDFKTYQKQARLTAQYPNLGSNNIYPTLGLVGEAGEVAEKVKKVIRDKNGIFDEESKKGIKKELGDVLWYISNLCNEFDFELEDVALQNLEKLKLRAAKGKISGSGDDR
jgi:NTP pyrophosphatase (non-canonical NTP hydrolase)